MNATRTQIRRFAAVRSVPMPSMRMDDMRAASICGSSRDGGSDCSRDDPRCLAMKGGISMTPHAIFVVAQAD